MGSLNISHATFQISRLVDQENVIDIKWYFYEKYWDRKLDWKQKQNKHKIKWRNKSWGHKIVKSYKWNIMVSWKKQWNLIAKVTWFCYLLTNNKVRIEKKNACTQNSLWKYVQNLCQSVPKRLKKGVCYQLKNYQNSGQAFWQPPNIRTLRQFGFWKTKLYRENRENLSHMEIKRGIKVKNIKPLPVKCSELTTQRRKRSY